MSPLTIHPDPWRADSLHAAVYVPAEPFPTLHVVILVIVVVLVMAWAGTRLIGGSTHDCDCDGPCLVAKAERGRHRRGL